MAAKRKTFLDGLLYFINVILALMLLGSYLAYYIPSSLTTAFSFLALAYPILFFTNLAFAIYWLIRLKVKIFLPIVVISIGYLHLGRLYQFGSPEKVVSNSEKIKVMSFNVRLLNQFRWIDADNIDTKIIQLIQDENPDVLLLQEFRHNWGGTPINLGFPYYSFKPSQRGQYGSAIFSKLPMSKSQVVTFENDSSGNNQFQYADLTWKDKTIRFINIHLASVGLEEADYQLLEHPNTEDQEQLESGLKSIVRNLHYAFERREEQVQTVVREIKASPHPVVLAGDFNDVPQSFVYHQVDAELDDSFINAGHGFGKSYVKSPVPIRIDYIFHSEELNAFNFKVIKKELSDHYPITTDLEWKL